MRVLRRQFMEFNQIKKDYIEVRYEEARPISPIRNPKTIPISKMSGAYLSGVETGIRELVVQINVYYDNFEDLQKKKEHMSEWLIHDEPKPLVFNDEQNRTYYAIYVDTVIFDEYPKVAIG